MIIGTHHFVSHEAACRYYCGTMGRRLKRDKIFIQRKIDAGEIAIGAPVYDSSNQNLLVNKAEGRYFIEDK